MKIVVLVEDLLFVSKIRNAAKTLNADIRIPKDFKHALAFVKSERPSSVIIDLGLLPCDPIRIIHELKSDPETKEIRISGFVSHVQSDLCTKALEAGCNVLPRSNFSQNIHKILQNRE
jgi:PleD family two-component response regulator